MTASPEAQLIDLFGLRFDPSRQVPPTINWDAIQECARKNRMLPLLYSVISERDSIPKNVIQRLQQETRRSFVATTLLAHVMKDVSASLEGIPWMLLRGPVLGELIYGNLSLRPYGDLDVLVSPESIDNALARLNDAAFLPSASSFPISFYRKYHLHVQLNRAGLAGNTSLELHWALDHPFTLLTVDIDGMLSRRESISIDHIYVARPGLEDLVVSLAIHAVKHAAPLHLWIAQHEPSAIVAHGMLLHFYDIAYLLQRYDSALGWAAVEERSTQWGADRLLHLCLQGIDLLWPSSLPDSASPGRPLKTGSRWQSIAVSSGNRAENGLVFKQIRGAVFRPIRVLDALCYLIPPKSYLVRRYKTSGFVTRIKHTVQALTQLVSGGISLLYYSSCSRIRRAARVARGVGK